MDWLEIIVETHSESVEAIAELLTTMGSKGVAIEDPLDYDQLTQEQVEWLQVEKKMLYQTDEVLIKAYFQPSQWSQELEERLKSEINQLSMYGLNVGKARIRKQEVGESDWADAWKKYYYPVRVSRFLTVVPSWIEYSKEQEQELLIQLDPGLAFGTGTHPTTQLSLMALEQYVRGGETVIDVGTGSGVLSIAAKLLGASQITAFDVDEMATRIAKENIALNENMEDIEVYENNLLVGIHQSVDLIVANILAEILVQMPQDAYQNLKQTGILILSGVIESKVELVNQAYYSVGFTLHQRMTMGEWNCLIFKKGEE